MNRLVPIGVLFLGMLAWWSSSTVSAQPVPGTTPKESEDSSSTKNPQSDKDGEKGPTGDIGELEPGSNNPSEAQSNNDPSKTVTSSFDKDKEVAAIKASAETYVRAFHHRDAKAMAQLWADDAVYINPMTGAQVKGRDAIQKQFEENFKNDGPAQIEVNVGSLRFLTPEVVLEEGTADITYADGQRDETKYSIIHVKKDGQWLITSLREVVVKPAGPQRSLEDLEWMVGEWVDATGDAMVSVNCRWGKNKTFLIRSIVASNGDDIDFQATQVVGWDAAQRTIRSWTFDVEGGFAQGTWSYADGKWSIKAKATGPDGKRSTSTSVITPKDDGSFTWESRNRVLAGELLPNIPPISMVRAEANPSESEEEAVDESPADAEGDEAENGNYTDEDAEDQ